ncbi:integrase core domain-containing protein [Kordiimonas sp.]|uniref:integrase core domain-containing protein n=1 Tax=Kordiimonas sp. TaxID=1970157 RepID=UPI003A916107
MLSSKLHGLSILGEIHLAPHIMPDNAFIESFNGKFRTVCLNAHRFLSLDDAREKMEEWRRDYNEVRPHSAIGNRPPIAALSGRSWSLTLHSVIASGSKQKSPGT